MIMIQFIILEQHLRGAEVTEHNIDIINQFSYITSESECCTLGSGLGVVEKTI